MEAVNIQAVKIQVAKDIVKSLESSPDSNVKAKITVVTEKITVSEDAIGKFTAAYDEWMDIREIVIQELKDLVPGLCGRQVASNATSVASASIGVAAGGLVIASFFFPVLIPVAAYTSAAAVTSAVGTVGYEVTKAVIDGASKKEAFELYERDKAASEKLFECLEMVYESMSQLQLDDAVFGSDIGRKGASVMEKLATAIGTVKTMRTAIVEAAEEAAKGGAAAAGRVGGAAAKLGSKTVAVAGIGLNVGEIVYSSIQLAKGSPSDAAQQIEETVDMLQKGVEEMKEIKEEIDELIN